jgi:ubiquinone/menaquinone biosynthesis C-methylase UbiE
MKSEFDHHSHDYEEKVRESLGPLSVTASANSFAKDKVARIARYHPRQSSGWFLDFGSGIGMAIPFIRNFFPEIKIVAADTSNSSLAVIQKTCATSVSTLHLDGDDIPLDTQSIDIAMAACVFHHIPPNDRSQWMRELYRVLKPGGSLWIFEHNPLNPFTQWIVRNSPLDENAVLLSQREVSKLAEQTGFKVRQRRYTLIGPPNWHWLHPVERLLAAIPIGAQYCMELRR